MSIFLTFFLVACASNVEAVDNQKIFSVLQALVAKNSNYKDKSLQVSVAYINLDDDEDNEIVAFVSGQSLCGSGGCVLYVLKRNGQSYKQVTRMTVARLPIKVFDDRSQGWLDLGVRVAGGGINPGSDTLLRFNGQTYPSNPSVEPVAAREKGRIIISSSSSARPLFD